MLVRQRSLKVDVPSHSPYRWFAPLHAQFEERFAFPAGTPKGFPCVFAQNAVKRRNVVFSLVPLKNVTSRFAMERVKYTTAYPVEA